MKHRTTLIIAVVMLLSVAGQSIAMAVTPTVEYTFHRVLNETSGTVWDYTEKDLSFGTGEYLYEKTLDDGHGDVLVMASASDTAVTVAEPSGIEFPTDDISYISMDLQPKSTGYPVGIDFFGVNGNPCGLSFNIFGVLLVGQGWTSSPIASSETEIDTYVSSLKYGKYNADEWVNIKVVNNQKDNELSFYVNDVLFKTESTALNHFSSMRIVQYNDKKNVKKGTEMLYIDNVEVGTVSYDETWNFKTGLILDGFGFSDSEGNEVREAQSDVCVKTTLTNKSENDMKVLIFISGYKDGVMEAVDLKMCNMAIGEELVIDNTSNTISLDSEKEYDRIQLSILDGESGYPLMEASELKAAK